MGHKHIYLVILLRVIYCHEPIYLAALMLAFNVKSIPVHLGVCLLKLGHRFAPFAGWPYLAQGSLLHPPFI